MAAGSSAPELVTAFLGKSCVLTPYKLEILFLEWNIPESFSLQELL